MKVLHVLRSEPNDLVRRFIRGMSPAGSPKEVALYQGPVDYARLVEEIFQCDQVICWW